MKNRVCAGFLFVLLFFAICAFTTLEARADSIRFWAALPEADNAEMTSLIDRYNEKHQENQVVFQNFPSQEALYQALEKNDLPELALIDSTWIATLKPKLVPADDVLEKAGEMVHAVAKADTFKPVWDTCMQDNKVYAIPFSAETAALVINPVHFKKVPKIDTVAQWEKVNKQIEKGIVNVTPMMIPVSSWEKSEVGELWTTFVYAQSSPLKKNPKDTDPHLFTLHDEFAAINEWWNWVNRMHLASTDTVQFPEGFIHGATWILLPRQRAALKDDPVVELLPKGKRPWGFLDVQALAFLNSDKGWDFVNYLTDYPQIKEWSMKTDTVPVNKQVYLSPDYLQDIDAHRPWMRVYIAEIDRFPHGIAFPYERLESVGEILLKSLHNDLKVQEGALKVHESLFGTPTSAP